MTGTAQAIAVGDAVTTAARAGDGPGDAGRAAIGTVGFLALRNGRRTREPVLVSCRHVLLANDVRRGDPVYGPLVARGADAWALRAADPVGSVLDEGAEDNHPYRYPGEPVREYFVDCACAGLTAPASTASPVRGVARIHPLDVAGARAVRVRTIGARGAAAGRVVDADAVIPLRGRPTRRGVIVIRGTGGPAAAGDSGALVVNDRDEAVGLVWGRSDEDPDLVYAAHIHPVLDRLGVTMLTRSLR